MVRRNDIYGDVKLENGKVVVSLENREGGDTLNVAGSVYLYENVKDSWKENLLKETRMQSLNQGETQSVEFDVDLSDGEYLVYAFVSKNPVFRFSVKEGKVVDKNGSLIGSENKEGMNSVKKQGKKSVEMLEKELEKLQEKIKRLNEEISKKEDRIEQLEKELASEKKEIDEDDVKNAVGLVSRIVRFFRR